MKKLKILKSTILKNDIKYYFKLRIKVIIIDYI